MTDQQAALTPASKCERGFYWRPMSCAPAGGETIMARRVPEDSADGNLGQKTWWGKTSHVPL